MPGPMSLIPKTGIADSRKEGMADDRRGPEISQPQDASLGATTFRRRTCGLETARSQRRGNSRGTAASQYLRDHWIGPEEFRCHARRGGPAHSHRRGPPPPTVEPPVPRPTLLEVWIPRIRKFAESPTRVYAAAGVGLGILFGITIAAISWHINNPNGPYDLRSVTSSAAGLKGHLFLKWDKKLQYRLTFEPSEPEQLAGFSIAVTSSPRPLSINIQLKDAQGFVLCAKDVLLQYDARKAAALAAPNPEAEAGNTDAGKISNDQLAQGISIAQLEAQEPERELDKDIFKNQIGPDGQIASISAQGDIPCSGKAYENTSYWSFSPGFPSLAEQGKLLKRQAEIRANEASAASEKLASRRRMATNAAPKPPLSTSKETIQSPDMTLPRE